MSEEMKQLWKIIEEESGTKLPFTGGTGSSLQDPILVSKSRNYVAAEYAFIKGFCRLREVVYRHKEQELVYEGSRAIDILTIETKEGEAGAVNEEKYYFDVTDCI